MVTRSGGDDGLVVMVTGGEEGPVWMFGQSAICVFWVTDDGILGQNVICVLQAMNVGIAGGTVICVLRAMNVGCGTGVRCWTRTDNMTVVSHVMGVFLSGV